MAVLAGLDGEAVRRWLRLAAGALEQTRSAIDALNVYPVPDSDTGTNLHCTLLAAADAADALAPRSGAAQVWAAASQGAMLGACGNSGIIVSQLLRGLGEICGPAAPCDGPVLARALAHATALARAAVSRPVEGTVLTVADAAALAAGQCAPGGGQGVPGAGGSLAEVVLAAAAGARAALARTEQQLDVLAASGVVDAGAAGLCVLLDALGAAVTGAAPSAYEVPAPAGRPGAGPGYAPGPGSGAGAGLHGSRPACYGYEVTYLLAAPEPAVGQLRERLDALGESLVIVGGDEQWHVHVHVPQAGAAIEEGIAAGQLSRITVTYLAAGPPPGGHQVIAIADGPGLAELLGGAGALVVRHRDGQPPAPAAVSAALRQAGRNVIFVPNGQTGAALASAAAARHGAAGSEVLVIDIRSPVQALAALAVHDPDREMTADAAAMSAAAAAMRYASVGPAGTGREIVGRVGEDITVRGTGQGEVAIAVARALLAGGAELVTLVQGAAAEPGLAQQVAWLARQLAPAAQIACYEAGPASAFLLIGAE